MARSASPLSVSKERYRMGAIAGLTGLDWMNVDSNSVALIDVDYPSSVVIRSSWSIESHHQSVGHLTRQPWSGHDGHAVKAVSLGGNHHCLVVLSHGFFTFLAQS